MIEALLRRESAVDVCARMLREAIVEGDLSPGEKLLPERELAQRLGVNRVTIRSALARLATGRLLEVRQGSGHRVRDFRRAGGPELIPLLLGEPPQRGRLRTIARDLLLVRRTLLGIAIERVAEEANQRDRERVRRAVEDLATTEDPAKAAKLERIVIDALLDASRSTVLTLALNPFLAVIDRLPGLAEAMAQEPRGNLDAWQILAAGLDPKEKRRAGAWLEEVAAELARHDLMVLSHLPRRSSGRSSGR